MTLKFVISKNNAIIKEINVNVHLEDFVNYRKLLNTSQKDINVYLTSLIGQDITGQKVFSPYFKKFVNSII